jgi:hypothetical protein
MSIVSMDRRSGVIRNAFIVSPLFAVPARNPAPSSPQSPAQVQAHGLARPAHRAGSLLSDGLGGDGCAKDVTDAARMYQIV